MGLQSARSARHRALAALCILALKAVPVAAQSQATDSSPVAAPMPALRLATEPSTLNWIGFGVALLGLGAIAGGYYFDEASLRAYEESRDALFAYENAASNFDALWADFLSKREALATTTLARLVLYISGGALVAGGLVMAFIPPRGNDVTTTQATWRLVLMPNGLAIGLGY